MNDAESAKHGEPACRTARIFSTGVSAAFLVIIGLALFNEDRPQAAAIPVLVLLGLTIVACFVAWRWPRAGGIAVGAGSIALYAAAYASSVSFGLGGASFITPLLFTAPFLAVALLFWQCAQLERE